MCVLSAIGTFRRRGFPLILVVEDYDYAQFYLEIALMRWLYYVKVEKKTVR